MAVTLTVICAALLLVWWWIRRSRNQHEKLEQHSITPEALQTLLAAKHDVLVFDVRQPLDLLADSQIIPGARRLAPKEVLENPELIPKEQDTVVYCTCPSDETSRAILDKALSLRLFRVKFLKGGLESWKSKGYPVEPYQETFHLDSAP